QQAGDLLLAGLHWPPDAGVLCLDCLDEVTATNDESDGRPTERLATGVGDKVGTERDITAQVLLCRGVDDDGHSSRVGDASALVEWETMLLYCVVGLDEQHGGGRLRERRLEVGCGDALVRAEGDGPS